METEEIKQDGPIAYVESTTLDRVFDEDANRCLLLATDERPSQTRTILETLGARFSGGRSQGDTTEVIARHHALQNGLAELTGADIVVPCAKELQAYFPDDRTEARRSFPQAMRMMQTLALLHHRQRPKDGNGRILAGEDDYRWMRQLMEQPLEKALGSRLSESEKSFFEKLLTSFPPPKVLNTQDAQRLDTQVCRTTVYGWLSALEKAGWLECVKPSRGPNPAKWRVAEHIDRESAAVAWPAPDGLNW